MKSYIIKPKSVKKSEIHKNEYSFSGFSYRYVESKNKNYFFLGSNEILDKNVKGFEPGSKEYIDFSENYFVRISEMDDLNFTFATSKDTKKIRPVENSNKSKVINQGDICYQTASNVGNVCIYDGKKAFYNSHIRKLAFKKNKYYIFAILKSAFGKEQVDVSGSIKGVDNFREEYLLNTKIPFPTTANQQSPEKIENLVSLIVQNIINKEEQIKAKNKQIDELIEKELKDNQKARCFSYNYPRISEIKEETRLDTGLYEREFKEIDFLIRNYVREFCLLDIFVEKFFSGTTPKFFEKQDGNYPYFVRPTEYNDKRVYTDLRKIHFDKNISKYRIDKKEGIILPRKGGTNTIYKPENFNVLIGDSVKFGIFKNINVSFLASFLSSNIVKFQLERIKSKTNGGSLTEKNLRNLLIPNFPESKQQEIAKLYYNPIEKNKDLSLENYLEKEQTRNREVGIFQLNMEIFALREQLEDLVHKIVMEEEIEIDLAH